LVGGLPAAEPDRPRARCGTAAARARAAQVGARGTAALDRARTGGARAAVPARPRAAARAAAGRGRRRRAAARPRSRPRRLRRRRAVASGGPPEHGSARAAARARRAAREGLRRHTRGAAPRAGRRRADRARERGERAARADRARGRDPAVSLGDRVRADADSAAVLDQFLGWVAEQGLSPYPEQEEAILELLADRHVVLSTPTGSGKSLVALAMQFRALCAGDRSFYCAPVKALVSEKFFALCEQLGADRVGMLTGDASI